MRLAIVSTFPPYRGGIATFNAAMARSLEEAGHEVTCMTWSRQYPERMFPGSSQFDPGFTLSDATMPANLDVMSPASWRKVGRQLGDMDVVVLPFWHAIHAPALAAVARHAKRAGAKSVWALMHNASSHDGQVIHRWLTRHFLDRVDRIITLSRGVSEALSPLPTTTLFHPLMGGWGRGPGRGASRQRLGLPAQARVHLFFGLIRPYKGLDILLQAMAELGPEHHVVIAGECYGSFAPYQTLIDRLKLDDRVHVFDHFIQGKDVSTFLDAADDMVLPYKTASQSGVTALALQHRIKVIASDVGDLGQTIIPELTGRLVPPHNPHALAEAMAESWTAQETDVKAAFGQIEKRLSWSAWAALLLPQEAHADEEVPRGDE
ncbi:MAG: glycosyltransferase [Bacteroidetes bacterium]|nr:glycosyltransferase [Bacteroidota bacterium]MDA0903018.1 glycosyltransferase [Bacteroidota bacterium]MDA1241772.1 glycosyltransferase [Bacteroidota bacterium]